MAKRLLNIQELYDLSTVIKDNLKDDYDYKALTITMELNEKELRMIDEEFFFRNNPTAKKKDFFHANIVKAKLNDIDFVFIPKKEA